MSHVTTHVLDAALGRPAVGIDVLLMDAGGVTIASGVTDTDGRIVDLGPEQLPVGDFRLVFDTGDYFAALGVTAFYPMVTIDFTISDASAHYHVPVLLSPFAYSTYRGS
ncbi:hydroxyisourate hydrolase [soil metagenome]